MDTNILYKYGSPMYRYAVPEIKTGIPARQQLARCLRAEERMKTMMSSRYLILALFATLVSLSAHAQEAPKATMSFTLTRADSGNLIVFSGETNFPVTTIKFSFYGQLKTNVQVGPVDLPTPSITPKVVGANVVGATFLERIPYGGASAVLDNSYSQVSVTATANQNTSLPAPAPVAYATTVVDMSLVENFFALLQDDVSVNQRLTGFSNINKPPAISPISVDPLDTSIRLHITSDQMVLVTAFAYEHGSRNAPAAQSDEQGVLRNGDTQLLIPGLQPGHLYDVYIRETGPHPNRGPQEATVLTDRQGKPLRTLDKIPTPVVSFVAGISPTSLSIVQNRQIKIPLEIIDAPRLKLSLQTRDSLGNLSTVEETIVSSGIQNPTPGKAVPQTVTFPLSKVVLDQKASYQVRVAGLTTYDDLPDGPAIITVPFSGLGQIISEGILFSFQPDGLEISATTGDTQAKLAATVSREGSASFNYERSTMSRNPSFKLAYTELVSQLTSNKANPPNGGATAGNLPSMVTIPLSVGIHAEDGSDREQMTKIQLSVSTAGIAAKSASDKRNLKDFKANLDSQPGLCLSNCNRPSNPARASISVSNILTTGLAAILKLFLPAL